MLKLANTVLILINPSPSNVKAKIEIEIFIFIVFMLINFLVRIISSMMRKNTTTLFFFPLYTSAKIEVHHKVKHEKTKTYAG